MNKKPRIKIQHFGAIQQTNPDNNGWLDIDKVTVFIGDQGSGKSTVAKLISTFMWIEKALVRGDLDTKTLQRKGKFTQFLKYHRLESYIQSNSYIEYDGLAKHIIFENNQLKVQKNTSHEQNYVLPQIMYVPAERNFISYVKNARELKIASESMQEFITEFNNAKRALKEPIALPINNIHLKYQEKTDSLKLKGENYEIDLSDGASGFQSAVPLLLVSNYLAKSVGNLLNTNNEPMSEKERENFSKEIKQILENTDLSDEQKRLAISLLSSKFNKKVFINIVEEPEQNLFPNSQWRILEELLTKIHPDNKLILATHSPYIINYLSIGIKANQIFNYLLNVVHDKIDNKTKNCPNDDIAENIIDEIWHKIYDVVPADLWLDSKELSVYQLKDGIVTLLPEIYGIPSDDNYLNQMLAQGNEIIDKLLEIEDEYANREFL